MSLCTSVILKGWGRMIVWTEAISSMDIPKSIRMPCSCLWNCRHLQREKSLMKMPKKYWIKVWRPLSLSCLNSRTKRFWKDFNNFRNKPSQGLTLLKKRPKEDSKSIATSWILLPAISYYQTFSQNRIKSHSTK